MKDRELSKSHFGLASVQVLGLPLGMLASMTTAAFFGADAATDVFNFSRSVVVTLTGLLLASIPVVFVPLFVERRETQGPAEAWRAANNLLNTLLLFAAVIVAGVAVFSHPVVASFSKFPAAQRDAAARMLVALLPMALAMGLNQCLISLLHANRVFTPASATNMLQTGCVLAVTVLFHKSLGLWSWVAGILAGQFSQTAVLLLIAARRDFPLRLSPRCIDFKDPVLLRGLVLYWPFLVTSLANSGQALTFRFLASGLPSGSLTALNYASTLNELPNSLFAATMGSVILPMLSAHAARGEMALYGERVVKAISNVWFVTIPLSLVLILFGGDIIALLLQRGRFDAAATALVARGLRCFSFGLFAQSAGYVTCRAYYARQDMRTPMVLALVTSSANVLLSVCFSRLWGLNGLALAQAASAMLILGLDVLVLRGRLGLDCWSLCRAFAKISCGAGLCLAAAKALHAACLSMLGMGSVLHQGALLGGSIGIALALFMLLGVRLGLEEAELFTSLLRRRFSSQTT